LYEEAVEKESFRLDKKTTPCVNKMKEPDPMRHLRIYTNRYPNAWNEYKKFTTSKGKNGLDDWPNWCFTLWPPPTALGDDE